MAGKHRVPEGQKSTSQKVQSGERASTGKAKHELAGEDTQVIKVPETTKSDIPHRDGRTDK